MHGIRRDATEALERMAPASIPALITALKDPDTNVRYYASGALVQIGPTAVPALIATLKDPDPVNRTYAIRTLLRLGPAASAAAPALDAALGDPDANVRYFAAVAIKRIGTQTEGRKPPEPASLSTPQSCTEELGENMVCIEPGCTNIYDIYGTDDIYESRNKLGCIFSAFGMGKYEVTYEAFKQYVKATGREMPNEYYQRRGNHPIIRVSWYDATAYAEWLSKKTGKRYRLPTEVEWVYAARAGTTTRYFWGDRPEEACRYANVGDAGSGRSWGDPMIGEIKRGRIEDIFLCDDGYARLAPVGQFLSNPWGLYDMLGNASEWTCSAHRIPFDGNEFNCTWKGADGPRAVRGTFWGDGADRLLHPLGRSSHEPTSEAAGFRLVQDL